MANRFWVGGTGNWDGTTNHFATTSGGTATLPGNASTDTCIFDANSGAGTVTLTFNPTITGITNGAHTGTLNLNGKTISLSGTFNGSGTGTRTLTMGAATLTCATWNFATSTSLTFNANTSSITMNGAGTTFAGGGLTYNNVTIAGSGAMGLNNGNTFTNLTLNGSAALTDSISFNASQTISTTLTIAGNSSVNRLLLLSNSFGTQRTLTVNSTVTASNCDFQDISGAGTASWNLAAITGLSGDAGGNAGITFTTPTTQTWSGTSGGNWSANAWTTHMPLPQDNVTMTHSWAAAQTVTADAPRLGTNITWASSTGSPTWAFSSTTNQIYGDVTLASGMTISGTNLIQLAARDGSVHTITSAGSTWTTPFQIMTAVNSTSYQLGDDMTISNTLTVGQGLNAGRIDQNNHNMTCTTFTGSFGCVLTMEASNTLTLTSTAAGNIFSMGALSSMNAADTSSIIISNASANSRTFVGNSLSYGILTYTVAGSTGTLAITGSNAFATLNFSDATNARTVTFANGTTTTMSSGAGVNWTGTSGKLTTVSSDSSGVAFTISAPSQVSVDFISLKDSTASGTTPFYAGANSTNVSGNTNWTFTAPPVSSSGSLTLVGVG